MTFSVRQSLINWPLPRGFLRPMSNAVLHMSRTQWGKGTGKRGQTAADTLLLMMFLGLRKLGNICCGHKMFLNKIRNIFCVPDTKFVSATNVARAGKWGNICVGKYVSSFARALKSKWCLETFDYAFGSTHVKIVWPEVGLQALLTAGQAWRTAQPFQI